MNPDSELARNFLVIAPNIIVLDRIYHDFQGLRVFFEDPVLPENGFEGRDWQDDFQLTLHLQDEVRVTRSTGNIFLTNIHRVYSADQTPPSPDDDNSMDYFLGRRPTGATTDSKIDLGIIVREVDELMVLNDEAHHIHDSKLAWFKSIEDIHNGLLQKGGKLALQGGCNRYAQAQQRCDFCADGWRTTRLWRQFRRMWSSIPCSPIRKAKTS